MSYDDELYHYGRLGMKWGQHIFGKARSVSKATKRMRKTDVDEEAKFPSGMSWGVRKSGKTSKTKSVKKKTTNKVQQTETKTEDKAAKKEAVLKSRSAKQLYDNADLFTDQELQSAYNRLVLERNIKSLTPKEVSKGEQYVNTAIKVTNKTATLIENSSKAYNAVAKIYNATSDGSKNPLPLVGGNNKKKDD